jgi:hypothetical protein
VDLADEPPSSPLESVTFDPESSLREIEQLAFFGCDSLVSICLPASLQRIDGKSLAGCGLREITIDPGNPFMHVTGRFIMDVNNRSLIHCCVEEEEVRIPSEIETFASSCFAYSDDVRTLLFDEIVHLSVIEDCAFHDSTSLQSICIPASVKSLGSSCFADCRELRVVLFCPGSQLERTGFKAFDTCLSLQSITLPPSLEAIPESCFAFCKSLEEVTLLRNSKLVRIELRAFAECPLLRSIRIPPRVEFVGDCCFSGCASLSNFEFSWPCRLQELLDLPPRWQGPAEIPDSVEILRFVQDPEYPRELSFGRESRLVKVAVRDAEPPQRRRSLPVVSTRSLKALRSNLEFEDMVSQFWPYDP